MTIHDEVAALLDGDMDKAREILAVVSRHIAAEAKRIETENVPALREFGLIEEPRARELAAVFVGEWAIALQVERTLAEVRERLEGIEKARARIDARLKEKADG